MANSTRFPLSSSPLCTFSFLSAFAVSLHSWTECVSVPPPHYCRCARGRAPLLRPLSDDDGVCVCVYMFNASELCWVVFPVSVSVSVPVPLPFFFMFLDTCLLVHVSCFCPGGVLRVSAFFSFTSNLLESGVRCRGLSHTDTQVHTSTSRSSCPMMERGVRRTEERGAVAVSVFVGNLSGEGKRRGKRRRRRGGRRSKHTTTQGCAPPPRRHASHLLLRLFSPSLHFFLFLYVRKLCTSEWIGDDAYARQKKQKKTHFAFWQQSIRGKSTRES